MAQALGQRMRELSVRSELCDIKVADQGERSCADKLFTELLSMSNSMLGMDPNIHGDTPHSTLGNFCSECLSTDHLQRCARCPDVFYCSKEHQRAHWTKHKRICGHAKRAQLDAMDYFNNAAYTSSKARGIAEDIDMRLTSGSDAASQ